MGTLLNKSKPFLRPVRYRPSAPRFMTVFSRGTRELPARMSFTDQLRNPLTSARPGGSICSVDQVFVRSVWESPSKKPLDAFQIISGSNT